MKKTVIYIFVLFYFLLSVGVTTNIHFCKDKVRSISFSTCAADYSCCGKKKMKKGCCKNIHVTFKKQGAEKTQTLDKIQLQACFIIPNNNYTAEISHPIIVNDAVCSPLFHSPPNSSFPDLYIKNCTFII